MGEVKAYLSYSRKDLDLTYWRSVNAQEVDLIVGDRVAMEIKATSQAGPKHLTGLTALAEESLVKRSIVVSMDPRIRKMGAATVYPWQEFLKMLWDGELI